MAKIPATIVTGFLGAGKTSMIRHLLMNAEGRKIALIVNEFGDVGVDGEILKGCDSPACAPEEIVELANGCICCTVADDFLPTIEAILARDEQPDQIVIETSGLALPKPLIKAFAWPEVKSRVTVDGVVAVVDARAVKDGLFATDVDAINAQREADENLDHESPLEELYEEQLGAADLIIVNKCDLIDDADRADIGADATANARPGVQTIFAKNGEVSASILLGLDAAAEDDLDSRKSHHDGVDEHEHDDFTSFVVDVSEVADTDELTAKIEALFTDHEVYRVKGFVSVENKSLRLTVQAVGGRVQSYFDGPAPTDRGGKLVVIGDHHIDEAAIRAALG